LDADDSSKHMDMPGNRLSSALTKQAAFIQDVRVKLGLTLQQADEIFGGAEGAFSRYEQMEAIPPRTIVHLLRILKKHPELLPEVRVNK
jgi:HTH-type transcriptional regulator/antitoxin MqsA